MAFICPSPLSAPSAVLNNYSSQSRMLHDVFSCARWNSVHGITEYNGLRVVIDA